MPEDGAAVGERDKVDLASLAATGETPQLAAPLTYGSSQVSTRHRILVSTML